MKKEKIILGKKYRVKSKAWFRKNSIEDLAFDKELCGQSFIVINFCDYLYKNENNVEVIFSEHKNRRSLKIPATYLENDPNDERKNSDKIKQLANKIKKFKYMFVSSNGSGAGEGKVIEMKDVLLRIGFDASGKECIEIPGGSIYSRKIWPIDKVCELVENKKTEDSWKATEYTYITDSVYVENDRDKLPNDFEWRDY
jgi:hypothetical protein